MWVSRAPLLVMVGCTFVAVGYTVRQFAYTPLTHFHFCNRLGREVQFFMSVGTESQGGGVFTQGPLTRRGEAEIQTSGVWPQTCSFHLCVISDQEVPDLCVRVLGTELVPWAIFAPDPG